MSRIEACLERLAVEKKKALIPYIVCGDPRPDVTLSVMHGLVKAGADIIELGVPFSDPMAEGPVIQKAHERALRHNVSLSDALELVREFRETDDQTPIVLMGYANPVERLGYQAFADRALEAGVDGLLTVDLPPEEALDLNNELVRVGIDTIFLLAPTTTKERAKRICDMATGYLYYVSLKGVTGAGHLDIADVEERVANFNKFTNLPICVGFGIKDPDAAKQIANIASGVVVGSVLVDKMGAMLADNVDDIADTVAGTIRDMRQAIDGN